MDAERALPQVRPAPLAALGQLLDWGDGLVSAQHVGRHMQYAVDDGDTNHPMIHRLARIQSERAESGVAARNLMALMEGCGFSDLVSEFPDQLVNHMVLPSRLLEFFQVRYPRKFATSLGVDETAIKAFWDNLRTHPDFAHFAHSNSVLRSMHEADWARLVPLTVHEDAGPYTKRSTVNIISFTGVLGRGPEKTSQFVIASYIKEGRTSHDDAVSMWGPILADFEKLATVGVGGYRFLLLFAKGDLEVRANSWGLPSYNGLEPCTECCANRGAVPWTDLTAQALWRPTHLSAAAYFARARLPLHPLVCSSFAWRYFCPLDNMHISDCNGVAHIIAGSVIRPLVLNEGRLGRNQQERLNSINERLAAFYNARPGWHRMPKLRLNNLVADGWCELNGQTVKAANTRALTPFLVELAEEFYNDEADEYQRLVLRTVRAFNRFYELMYEAGVFMSASEVSELRRALLRLGASVMQLRELARQRRLLAWRITPKMHMVQHVAALAALINPRFVQNYCEESQVGSTTQVWSRSARGRYRRTVQRLVLVKRLVALVVRLEREL